MLGASVQASVTRSSLEVFSEVYGILYCLIGLGAVGATLVAWAGIRLKAP